MDLADHRCPRPQLRLARGLVGDLGRPEKHLTAARLWMIEAAASWSMAIGLLLATQNGIGAGPFA